MATLPAETRHRNPDAMGRRTPMVPAYTATERGDLKEGFIDLPKRLVKPIPLTNAWHEQQRTLEAATSKWVDWKAKQGWQVNSRPKWRGPYDLPTRNAADEVDNDRKRYYVTAYFVRTSPLWVPTDAQDWIRLEAERYGIDTEAPYVPWTDEGKGKAVIKDASPAHDPLKYAEQRRKKLGIERKDYLIGDLSTPLGNEVI